MRYRAELIQNGRSLSMQRPGKQEILQQKKRTTCAVIFAATQSAPYFDEPTSSVSDLFPNGKKQTPRRHFNRRLLVKCHRQRFAAVWPCANTGVALIYLQVIAVEGRRRARRLEARVFRTGARPPAACTCFRRFTATGT